MSDRAIAGTDDLQEGMGIGRAALQLNGESSEQDDLDSSTRGIPEGTRDTIGVGDSRRLEQGSGPGPGRHDGRGDETRLDRSASRAEHLRGLKLGIVSDRDDMLVANLAICHRSPEM